MNYQKAFGDGQFTAMALEAGEPHGPCCACGEPIEAEHERVALFLPFKGPEGSVGWGCVKCGLDDDGAVALVHFDCVENAQIRMVTAGHTGHERVTIKELGDRIKIPHVHDAASHFADFLIHSRPVVFQPGTRFSLN